MMSRILSVTLAGTLALTACNRSDQFFVADNTPAEAIFAEADKQIERGRGVKAGDYLMEVERLYPFTPEAERALILAAKAYHDDNALLESRMAAQRYLDYFPGSPNAPLATYLVALSYYDAIVDIKRDQKRTFEALKALQQVIDEYPDSEYAKLAAPKFDIALNQLAGKEMDIGRYYLSQDYFAAAAGRFKAVIEEYPSNANTNEAHHRLVETYLRMGLRSEAEAVYQDLARKAPESSWTKRSFELLKTGTQPNAGVSVVRRVFTGSGL